MTTARDVELDMNEVARYWALRKFQYIDRARMEFELLIDPALYHAENPSNEDMMLCNQCFTEWMIFDWTGYKGGSLLQGYLAAPPRSLGARRRDRIEQIAGTQRFSRFEILDKDPSDGMLVLRDVQDLERYEVSDEHACNIDRWRDGTLGIRIAQVDGSWYHVGINHLYDKAPVEVTGADGPGMLHEEELDRHPWLLDSTFFERLLHDVMGSDGRYQPTMRSRSLR